MQAYTTIGAYHYNARFYSTMLGRFMSADTVTQDLSSSSLNRYAYVRNAPTRFTDPTGHCVFGLECSPEIALNLAACAQSHDGCSRVFYALGIEASPQYVQSVHEFSRIGVGTIEYWVNFFSPDVNPYLNGPALLGKYGGHYRLDPIDYPLTTLFTYLNLTYNRYFPSKAGQAVEIGFQAAKDLVTGQCRGLERCSRTALALVGVVVAGAGLASGDPLLLYAGMILYTTQVQLVWMDYQQGDASIEDVWVSVIAGGAQLRGDSAAYNAYLAAADLAVSIVEFVDEVQQ
jgi:RHS repeat-associated protein